ncbi:phage portal protein [Chromohalobacter nigrandesensis]|uniref:phage portal protein n=1 Tax=Chromohalobacter nigrandesensis TaxID=119863 RepID=UPI001FF4802A|nr:phage portal protein [Chromohalobacter nigrandesensis]MCK0744094.1 phage portal protein [Chromohalobacter nigrandesensis]
MTTADKPRMRVPATLSESEPAAEAAASAPARAEAFTFGEPVPVTDLADFLYTGCWMLTSRWYEPPVDLPALAKVYRATAHHGSSLQVKRNILSRSFIPHRLLSRQAFRALVTDYLVFGNAYIERVYGRLGRLLALRPARAKYVRRGVEEGQFWWVTSWQVASEFERDSVIHLMEPDINQEIYGVPDYLGALQSILLNENATLFRRKYYLNGSHAGFVMYVSDTAQNQEDIDAMRTALKESKGVGNFRNLFLHSPGGKKDGVQIIPISEVAAKDEFAGIKQETRDDTLASHRVPPQLMGVMPNNVGGFGDVEKAAKVFVTNELEPLQAVFEEINDILGEQVIRFREYSLDGGAATATAQ